MEGGCVTPDFRVKRLWPVSYTHLILINIFFNYMFIFGKFGAPAMGVVGAALATLIARIVEMTALLLVVYLKKSPIACRPRAVSYTHLDVYKRQD